MRIRPSALRFRRLSAGLTQDEFARAVGLTQPHYSQLETGKSGVGVKTANKLAKYLGCDILDLVIIDVPDELDASSG